MTPFLQNPTPPDPTPLPPPNGRTKGAAQKGIAAFVAKKRGSHCSLPLRVDYCDSFSTWSELLTTVPTSTELYISKLGRIKEPRER